MASTSKVPTSSEVKKSNENGNGLLLYQFYPSFYSQKVVFALQEKKLKYKTKIVDLSRGEQLEPSYLKINPKGEVPVLQDGVKIIPDSKRIIDYVEDNFSNGNTPRLIPEKGSVNYQTMERMRDLLDNVPIPLITFGCIFHPSLTGKMNMSPVEQKIRQNMFSNLMNLIKEYSEKYVEFRDYYSTKLSKLQKLHANCIDINEVEKGILDVEYALKEVEKLLASHEGDKKTWWLCCEKFTIPDITLCLILNRLYNLGLTDKFFKDNQLPCIQEYFKRAQQRESFKKTINQGASLLKTFCCMEKKDQMFVTVGSVAMALCVLGLAAFLVQRKKM